MTERPVEQVLNATVSDLLDDMFKGDTRARDQWKFKKEVLMSSESRHLLEIVLKELDRGKLTDEEAGFVAYINTVCEGIKHFWRRILFGQSSI